MNCVFDSNSCDKIAIVVVGYNRLDAIKRLLCSLINAKYPNSNIPLVISIDASGDLELYNYVKEFEWPHGKKYVNIEQERLGLRNHIIQCGDLTRFFKAVILFEDDIFVSEYFYEYVESVINYYGDNDKIGGIALFEREVEFSCYPYTSIQDGSDTYLRQATASWGECWTASQWRKFKEWYQTFSDDRFYSINMPEFIKQWKRAWTKYFMAYLIETNRYFIFPHISLTTCFGDVGEHSNLINTVGQVNFLQGYKEYHLKPVERMKRYDIYGVNEDIYEWLGLENSDLCVDWYGYSKNINNCRYILTTIKLPYEIVRSFGLLMRPIELNVKYGIEGRDIFMYDTKDGKAFAYGHTIPLSVVFYHLRSYNFKLALRYALYHYKSIISKKIFGGK